MVVGGCEGPKGLGGYTVWGVTAVAFAVLIGSCVCVRMPDMMACEGDTDVGWIVCWVLS